MSRKETWQNQTIESNFSDEAVAHAGNSPRTRATYSLRIVPDVNSEVSVRAQSGDRAMIIRPDVSLSRRLTADETVSKKQAETTIGRHNAYYAHY